MKYKAAEQHLYRYLVDCKLYGWKPSTAGLAAYAREMRLGLRERWRTS